MVFQLISARSTQYSSIMFVGFADTMWCPQRDLNPRFPPFPVKQFGINKLAKSAVAPTGGLKISGRDSELPKARLILAAISRSIARAAWLW
jgi:hypothetical protein